VLAAFVVPFDAAAQGSGGLNSAQHIDAPYLLLVSIDGLGNAAMAEASTPALDAIGRGGVRASAMRPVFPTLTFPNHYSIATGLYPAEHGIVGNEFPSADRQRWYSYRDRLSVQDPAWYGGVPIWVRAEQAGMVAAAFFFVGTEAPIAGIRPTYSYLYDQSVPGKVRIEQVLDWLALPGPRRPHLVTLYFEAVDVASHRYGPGHPRTRAAIEAVDGLIGRLLAGVARLPLADEVYVIVVSDHGQAAYEDPRRPYVLEQHIDITDARMVDGGNYVMLYFERPERGRLERMADTINAGWDHGTAYLREDAPAHWRVPGADTRYADLIVQANPGHAVVSSVTRRAKITPGAHGWDPHAPGQAAIFLATGPRLPAARRIGEISVVDVYPLMLDILGLAPPAGYDTGSRVLSDLLGETAHATD